VKAQQAAEEAGRQCERERAACAKAAEGAMLERERAWAAEG